MNRAAYLPSKRRAARQVPTSETAPARIFERPEETGAIACRIPANGSRKTQQVKGGATLLAVRVDLDRVGLRCGQHRFDLAGERLAALQPARVSVAPARTRKEVHVPHVLLTIEAQELLGKDFRVVVGERERRAVHPERNLRRSLRVHPGRVPPPVPRSGSPGWTGGQACGAESSD